MDEEGRIHVVCLATLTVVGRLVAARVVDLVLLEEGAGGDLQYLLTVEDQGDKHIEIRSSRGYHLNYRLKVRGGRKGGTKV